MKVTSASCRACVLGEEQKRVWKALEAGNAQFEIDDKGKRITISCDAPVQGAPKVRFSVFRVSEGRYQVDSSKLGLFRTDEKNLLAFAGNCLTSVRQYMASQGKRLDSPTVAERSTLDKVKKKAKEKAEALKKKAKKADKKAKKKAKRAAAEAAKKAEKKAKKADERVAK